ncbi:MAG TPA: type II toxin-antitoxin system PemK/MazF family toxin [Ignavibacteriales bacterium]|nr:type II toxin-antitoxin system PemK/MazF family toxin [Ignavibacteriales bacterium]
MNYLSISRGDVVDINLEPALGSEIGKVRPGVVVQNNRGNQFSPMTIIAAVTGAEHIHTPLPVMVFIPAGKGGLTKDSYVDCGQIRSVDKESRIVNKRGTLDEAAMAQIDRALKISLALK